MSFNQPMNITENISSFTYLLRSGNIGGVECWNNNNLYLLIGMAKRGINDKDVSRVEEQVDKWCMANDARHPEGWILITHGDPDYGHYSVHTVAKRIADKGVPVVCIQSYFSRKEDVVFPDYAKMVLIGKGVLGYENGKITQVWGGNVRNEALGIVYARTKELAFPDRMMTSICLDSQSSLADSLGGILVVGGGNITRDQCEIYGFLKSDRPGDLLIACNDLEGKPSILNWVYSGLSV